MSVRGAAQVPEAWSETLAKVSDRLRNDMFGEGTFDGTIEYGTIGHISLHRVDVSRHRATPAGPISGRPDVIKLILQLEGHSIYDQGGESVIVSPGDCLAYDPSLPYGKTTPARSRHLAVVVPKDASPFGSLPLTRLSSQRFSLRRGVGRVALDTIASTFDAMAGIPRSCEPALVRTILDLLQLTLSQHDRPETPDVEISSLRGQIKGFIRRNLRDPELCVDKVALALGRSKRYVHMVFAREETTITDYIWASRLEQCLLALSRPSVGDQTLTEIAFSWGFNSSSHFSHAFRRRFSVPPSVLHRATRSSLLRHA